MNAICGKIAFATDFAFGARRRSRRLFSPSATESRAGDLVVSSSRWYDDGTDGGLSERASVRSGGTWPESASVAAIVATVTHTRVTK